MKGATPVACAKIKKNAKTNSTTTNGITNHNFACHKNSKSSLASTILFIESLIAFIGFVQIGL